MSKVIYIDTETTGLNHNKNGLVEVACIVEIDGKEVDQLVLEINPFTYNKDIEVSQEALNINGKTIEQLKSYPKSKKQFKKFLSFIEKHVDPRVKGDTFKIVGYNVAFDVGFIRSWFYDNQNDEYGYYFNYKDLDVFTLVKHFTHLGLIKTTNEKLGTLCVHFGIPLKAHQALDDIRATKTLYEILVKKFIKGGK